MIKEDGFAKCLQEVDQARDEYNESRKILLKLFNKVERWCERTERNETKNNPWSIMCFLFSLRRFSKALAEVEAQHAISDMCLNKWKSTLEKLESNG